jgi:hypothetical protein
LIDFFTKVFENERYDLLREQFNRKKGPGEKGGSLFELYGGNYSFIPEEKRWARERDSLMHLERLDRRFFKGEGFNAEADETQRSDPSEIDEVPTVHVPAEYLVAIDLAQVPHREPFISSDVVTKCGIQQRVLMRTKISHERIASVHTRLHDSDETIPAEPPQIRAFGGYTLDENEL